MVLPTSAARTRNRDLPLALQQRQDGWLSRTTADHFAAYAKVCFERFGDRVKRWITINEPWVVAVLGHDTGEHAPGHKDYTGTEVYQARCITSSYIIVYF